jgi:ATP-dependent exoDNAse (exonuclease V) beta subunit
MLIHGLLEHAMQSPAAARADRERLARWLLLEHADLRPFVPQAVDAVEAVMRAPFWGETRSGGACQVEVPFAIRLERPSDEGRAGAATVVRERAATASPARGQQSLFDLLLDTAPAPPCDGVATDRNLDAPDGSGKGTVIRGVIDLVYRREDGWRIIDYKTDRVLVDASELVARYGPQVNRYRDAWRRLVPDTTIDAELFHVRTLQAAPVEPR